MKSSTLHLFNPVFKTGLICIALLFSAFISLNAQIATWTFEPDPGTTAPATVATNATAANAVFGPTVNNIGFVNGNGPGTEAYTGSNWSPGGIAGDRYLDFTVTADAGYTIDVTSISFDLDRSGTGPEMFNVGIADNLAFAPSQIYGGSLNSALASTNYESFTFSGAYSGEVIKVRIFGFNASGTSGTLRFDNVVIDGTVSLIAEAPTSSCADPIEISADYCPSGIGPGTPSGLWGSIPASGMIQLQVGPIHLVDLTCLMDDVSDVGDMEIRLASSQFVGTQTTCLGVIEAVYDIRDAAGNIAPDLVTVHFTLSQVAGNLPVITCPADVSVEFGDPTDPGSIGEATATSDCGTPTLSFEDGAPVGSTEFGGPGQIVIRTWTATDCIGQTMTCDQEIFTASDPIPTMGQWALFILALLLSSMALVTIKKSVYSIG